MHDKCKFAFKLRSIRNYTKMGILPTLYITEKLECLNTHLVRHSFHRNRPQAAHSAYPAGCPCHPAGRPRTQAAQCGPLHTRRIVPADCGYLNINGKAIDFTSPRTSSVQDSWSYEMVPSGTILGPSECGRKPQGENHQVLAMKCERHPTCSPELNPGISRSSSHDSNSGCSGERGTCYHGATKPLFKIKHHLKQN